MMDYIKWMFKIDFYAPRYIITRELGMEILKIGWGKRSYRFEGKIQKEKGRKDSIMESCWKEKETYG